jgi:hypothetical protein
MKKKRSISSYYILLISIFLIIIFIFVYIKIDKEILLIKSSKDTITFYDLTTQDALAWENVDKECVVSYTENGIKTRLCLYGTISSGIQKGIVIPNFARSLHLYICVDDIEKIPVFYLVVDDKFVNKIILYDFLFKQKCLDVDFDIRKIADDKPHLIKIITGTFKGIKETEGATIKAIYLSKRESVNQILERNVEFIDFTDYLELLDWKKEGMINFEDGMKLVDGPCNELSSISKTIEIKNNFLEISACADYSGNDGTILYLYIDDYLGKFYVPSNSCNTTHWNVSRFVDGNPHKITLFSYFYRNYSYENVYVKNMSFLSNSSTFFELTPSILDLIDPIKIKDWYQKDCENCSICHMVTDITNCNTPVIASKQINIPSNVKYLIISAYTGYAGGDGVKAKVYLDSELISEFKIESESEKIVKIDISNYTGNHVLNLLPEIYRNCSNEMIYWQEVRFIQ